MNKRAIASIIVFSILFISTFVLSKYGIEPHDIRIIIICLGFIAFGAIYLLPERKPKTTNMNSATENDHDRVSNCK